jgi:phage shock protein PspC (stress-responsive transcriptional regulator)|tara:strand:+ start:264 stop:437 length:174 start_codon:yes stop_codon:yes gene_type:complete
MLNKTLYRGGGYIGGVCEGLGRWSGIPSILWRILFLFLGGGIFWIYILLWIVLPKRY